MLDNHLLLFTQFVVSLVALSLILLDLERPVGDLFLEAVDASLELVDRLRGGLILV